MGISNFLFIGIAIIAFIFIIQFFVKLKNVQDELKTLADQRFEGKTIHLQDHLALLIAQQSRGFSQRRGNGNLILSDDELFFTMTIPRTVFSIPLKNITDIERPLRMNGQCIMKKLVKVSFKTETGEDEAIGWHIKEGDSWEREILRLRSKQLGTKD